VRLFFIEYVYSLFYSSFYGHIIWMSNIPYPALGKTMEAEIQVTLRLTVSQSICLGIEHPCGTCDQILLPLGMLLSEICVLVSVGRPLWREDGSAICGVTTQRSESLRTRNHTILSHLKFPQPGRPGSLIYIPQEQGIYAFIETSSTYNISVWTAWKAYLVTIQFLLDRVA
jgi:hypothetical protein